MSSLDSLPHTVTTRILDYAISNHMDTIGAWKTKLPLLATCKRWRAIGKSLVYKTIYFESKPPGIDRSSSSNDDDEQGLEPGSFDATYDNSRVTSNMNLVKTVNAMCNIKHIAIKMSHSEHVRWLTLVLKREHCTDAGCWNTIELLQLSIDHDNRADTPSEKDIVIELESDEWERELVSLLAATKQLMPVILTLELRGDRTSVTEPFYNRIIEQYSGRVQSVSNMLPANIYNILYKCSDEFYSTLNCMLSGINVLQMATLKIRNMDFILDSGRTNWVNLTHLRFDKLDCRRLFQLLPRTPSLISMTVDNFITKGVMGVVLGDEEGMSESVEPLASNVQNLALVNRTRNDTKDCFIQSIVIILMHMPLVRNFCNTSDTKGTVEAYIDKYKDKYPHFRELVVYDHLPCASHGDKLFFE
ncbi:hypothetical protein LPJ66_000936 [Kickxella alabastrina]|uniref:Uncharacterized protein n=1 Tax=Kickxella alabastrina TaxID=61397 RepID=A0ACC1IUX9_9FUNG|nr:hypothetical protein LPJ66_000936 [Kickxella alabastrina]